jgi:hypothetical protein
MAGFEAPPIAQNKKPMTINRTNQKQMAPEYLVKRGAVSYRSGNGVRYIAKASFDPSADSTKRPVATYGLGVYIPINAIVTNTWWDVITTFTTAGADAGTIAIQVQAAGDVVAAIAVSAAGDVWDAGIHGGLHGSAAEGTVAGDTAILDAARKAGSYLKTTAEREVSVVVGGQALTAGKMVVFVEYVLSA